MGAFSIWHWVIVAVVILVLFGSGKIAKVMGELGKGAHEFKKGLKEGASEEEKAEQQKLEQAKSSDEEAAKS